MSDINFYKKIPETIQAIQYNGTNIKEVIKFLKVEENSPLIPNKGEYVVKYISGEYEIFSRESFNRYFENI
tara:strand:+ start:161 stop:373 length:213 start_codon:yes stop_codon:yes gene_type:complete